MVKYSKRRNYKTKRRYNKSKRRYNKTKRRYSKRRYNKTKRRYNKTKRRYSKRRYSKKNQHGGMMNSVRRQLSPEPEIIAREYIYTDLRPPLLNNTYHHFRDTNFRPNPILPHTFRVQNTRTVLADGDVFVPPPFTRVYIRKRGVKMFVIGVAYSVDGGATYQKKVMNQNIANALLQNDTDTLYPTSRFWQDGDPKELCILKIIFTRGFIPEFRTVTINKPQLEMMIDRFSGPGHVVNVGPMAQQFFFNVPQHDGSAWLPPIPVELARPCGELNDSMRRMPPEQVSHELAGGNTLIPVGIKSHLIIDETPDRTMFEDLLLTPEFRPPSFTGAILLSFLCSPIHLETSPPPPPPQATEASRVIAMRHAGHTDKHIRRMTLIDRQLAESEELTRRHMARFRRFGLRTAGENRNDRGVFAAEFDELRARQLREREELDRRDEAEAAARMTYWDEHVGRSGGEPADDDDGSGTGLSTNQGRHYLASPEEVATGPPPLPQGGATGEEPAVEGHAVEEPAGDEDPEDEGEGSNQFNNPVFHGRDYT